MEHAKLIRYLKLTIGAILAILIARAVGLTSPLSVGTLVFLSLGSTRLSSFKAAWVRVKSLAAALVLASIIFTITDFSIYGFLLFIALFVAIVVRFGLNEGLVIGVVQSSQIFGKEVINAEVLLNTIGLFTVGVTVAFLINLYMPDMKKAIQNDQHFIETSFKEILTKITEMLRGEGKYEINRFETLERYFTESISRTQANEENHLIHDVSVYGNYIRFRNQQFYILRQMYKLATSLTMKLEQGTALADLIQDISQRLSQEGTGEETLARIEAYRKDPLLEAMPASKEEFRNRALLFQILNELNNFSQLKQDYHLGSS